MLGSRKLSKIRFENYRFGGVNEGFRARFLYQKKEGKERNKMVVLVLLGDRRYGGGGRIWSAAANPRVGGKR